MGRMPVSQPMCGTTLRVFHAATALVLVLGFSAGARASRSDTKTHAIGGMCVLAVSSTTAPSAPSASNGAALPLHVPSPLRLADPPAPSEDDLPWCVSADDPRCAPLQHDASPPKLAARVPVTAHANDDFGLAPVGELSRLSAHVGLVPHAGFEPRIERPPRS